MNNSAVYRLRCFYVLAIKVKTWCFLKITFNDSVNKLSNVEKE